MIVLMWNVCYLAIILIFLVVTVCYPVVAAGYCSLLGSYWFLLLVTGDYCSFPLITACSHF